MHPINDCHVHLSTGKETARGILKAMDACQTEHIVLFSPEAGDTIRETRRATNCLARIVRQGRGRLFGFARLNPTIPGITDEIHRAIEGLNLTGIKMLPKRWYPYEERLRPVYEVINQLKAPILFHSGILWGHGASSMYCRPVFYECLMDYPNIRFALAHIGWPWTDECLALAGRFWHGGLGRGRMFVDITPGAPRIWKLDAMRKALAYLPHEALMYGSDHAPWRPGYRDWVQTDFDILHDCDATKPTIQGVMRDNFFGFVRGDKPRPKSRG
jgi:predicted TIM-barrel fold metal-dependent hydrolase